MSPNPFPSKPKSIYVGESLQIYLGLLLLLSYEFKELKNTNFGW